MKNYRLRCVWMRGILEDGACDIPFQARTDAVAIRKIPGICKAEEKRMNEIAMIPHSYALRPLKLVRIVQPEIVKNIISAPKSMFSKIRRRRGVKSGRRKGLAN